MAALVVLAGLLFLIQPALLAVAAPGQAALPPVNPVRVRIAPAAGALGGGTLRPGVPHFRPVRIHNDGESRFRYDVAIVATGELTRLVRVEFRAVEESCDAAAFAASPAVVAGPAPMENFAGSAGRVLDPGASELLCARLELPRHAAAPAGPPVADAVLRVSAVAA